MRTVHYTLRIEKREEKVPLFFLGFVTCISETFFVLLLLQKGNKDMRQTMRILAAIVLLLSAVGLQAEGSNPFTTGSFQLVTDVSQLSDSDQIIIGVDAAGVNKIMGYYDANKSKNNIRAIAGQYTDNRTRVTANEDATYTLHKTELNGKEAFYIQDEIRYVEAYLVASGGKTKNVLAIWDKLTDSKTYGNYGYWDISVADNGAATIMNLGNSKGKYLQYNATNALFACYEFPSSQTPVCIYRYVAPLGDTTMILVPMTDFGLVCKTGERATGSKTITVYANGLEEDIRVQLKHGAPFSLSTTQIGHEGGEVNISYDVTETGEYRDTIVMTSGKIIEEAPVFLQVTHPMKVADAVQEEDYATLYLDTVVVTKKYDHYIFVRDNTGSMLIYDNGDADGKRYGKDLKNGHVLVGVTGKYQNYFGVPELLPSAKWRVLAKQVGCLPEPFVQSSTPIMVDSAMVCRYMRFDNVVIDSEDMATSAGLAPIKVTENIGGKIVRNTPTTLDAIVMISHDEVQLWLVRQEKNSTGEDTPYINVVDSAPRKCIQDGQMVIIRGNNIYSASGIEIK